jgi:hypothetical protein
LLGTSPELYGKVLSSPYDQLLYRLIIQPVYGSLEIIFPKVNQAYGRQMCITRDHSARTYTPFVVPCNSTQRSLTARDVFYIVGGHTGWANPVPGKRVLDENELYPNPGESDPEVPVLGTA